MGGVCHPCGRRGLVPILTGRRFAWRLEAIGEAEAVVSNGNERKEGPSIERKTANRASVDRKTIAHGHDGKKVWRNTDEREERKIDFARIRAARSVVGRGYCLLSHPKRTQNTLDTEYATPNTPSHDHRYVRQTTASSIR